MQIVTAAILFIYSLKAINCYFRIYVYVAQLRLIWAYCPVILIDSKGVCERFSNEGTPLSSTPSSGSLGVRLGLIKSLSRLFRRLSQYHVQQCALAHLEFPSSSLNMCFEKLLLFFPSILPRNVYTKDTHNFHNFCIMIIKVFSISTYMYNRCRCR